MSRFLGKGIRWASGGVLALTLLALLSSCGSAGSGGNGPTAGLKGPKNPLVACPHSTNGTAASPESGHITLNVSGFTSSPAEDALVVQGFKGFEAQNPNITVNWSPIPTNYDTKMRANVAAGNVPDVFYVTPPMGQEYASAGKLLNLSPYMERDNVQPSSFYANLQQPFDCADGTVYGIPKDWNTLGLFYNKTMFQKAGLGDPSTWTWSDFQNAAKMLTTKGVYGAALPPDASRWGAFLYANGGQMLSSNGKSAAFNSSAGMNSASYYTGFESSKTGVQPSDVGAGWDGEAFGKQEVAMTFEGGWMIPFMTTTYPNVQYGIAPMPIAPTGQRGNLLYTNAWGAYSGTKHPDAAWKLVEYMTGATYQKQVLDDGFALPTIQSLANDPYFTQNPGVKVLQDGAAYGHADFYGAADAEVHTQVANALQSVMLGKASVTAALNTAAQNVDTWIQQNEAP